MKRAVIISGGKIQTDFALAFLRTQTWDYVIGADKGVIFCHKNQIMPTHIVGDFDSAGETEYEYFQKNTDVPIKRLNPVKDYTDTDVALRLALELGAGHGTEGGAKVKTLCHPDGSEKVTGGSTAAGATEAAAVSGGMTFQDGTPEQEVTLRMAQILRDKLLSSGYDVLMLRDSEDVQLDNVARTVICNNVADCHIALHWDSGDGKNYDKGCFYISVPEALKNMEPVASHWRQHDTLGTDLVEGLREQGTTIYGKGHMGIDLTQTSYSTIPSVDMELGNAYSDHSDVILEQLATGLLTGINTYFEQ